MIEPDENGVVHCYQCDWPMLRGQMWMPVIGLCPDCGNIEPVGVVHTQICYEAAQAEEPRATTQKRRAGSAGLN